MNLLSKEHFETIVVGGGPKGLMLQREAEAAGMDSLLLEAGDCGRTWNDAHMNKRMPITPSDLELSNLSGEGFQDFLRGLSPAQVRRNPLLEGRVPTVGHLRAYLRKVKSKVNAAVSDCFVSDIHPIKEGCGYLLETSKGMRRANNVVLSTGLVGYGKTEFQRDPTGLLGQTHLVQHQPVSLRHERDMAAWLAGARSVAIIGAGPAAYSSLTTFKNLKIGAKVHLIEDGDIEEKLSGRKGAPNREFKELAERFLPGILGSGLDITFHNRTKVGRADEVTGGIELSLSASTSLEVDRVLLCTGFAYDFARLPFAQRLLAQGVELKNGFPVINGSHQLMGDKGPLNIYMLGVGASHLGHDQIPLRSTPEAVQRILSSIQVAEVHPNHSAQKSVHPCATY